MLLEGGTMSRFVTPILISAIVLSGCQPYGWFAQTYRRLNVDGAPPVVNDKKYVFSRVDLVPTLTDGKPVPAPCITDITSTQCLAGAYADFYEQPAPVAGMTVLQLLAFRRNDVQERLISASNESCAEFK